MADTIAISAASRAQSTEKIRTLGSTICMAASFVAPLVTFMCSAAHEPASWDTAELQGVPYILGIAHPTGFPLYTMLGYVFSHVFVFGSVAYRLNVFSGLCVSVAALCCYLTTRELGVRHVTALIGALWYSVTTVTWTHASRAEAHTLALAVSTLCILLIVKWYRSSEYRYLAAASLVCGLALATHPVAIWLLPGFVCAALYTRVKISVTQTLQCAGMVLACLLFYAYLPLRSWYVLAHHLDPSAALSGANGLFWNYNNPHTFSGFLSEVSGSQFSAGGTLMSALAPPHLQTYLWTWLGDVNAAYGLFGMVLAVVGVVSASRRDGRLALIIAVLCFAAVPFSAAYANVEGDPDRYRLLSLWAVPIFMCAASLSSSNHTRARDVIVAALMLLWGAETFQNNYDLFANHSSTGGRGLISEAARTVPERAVVVTPWLDATSLAYGAYVDGTFKGRTIVGAWPGELVDRYAEWITRVPVYIIAPARLKIEPVRTETVAVLDGSHTLYRIVGLAGRKP